MDPTDFPSWVQWVWSQLPAGWFLKAGTLINAVVGMIATGGEQNTSDLDYMVAQSRIATATGFWLDVISAEFFGLGNLPRRAGEADSAFRARILDEMLRIRCTRTAMISALTDLTGVAPTVFEPAIDLGCWDVDLAWDSSGAWGSYDLTNEGFVDVALPQAPPLDLVGWDNGAWDQTATWIDATQEASVIAEEEVYRVVRLTQPAGVKIWARTWPAPPL